MSAINTNSALSENSLIVSGKIREVLMKNAKTFLSIPMVINTALTLNEIESFIHENSSVLLIGSKSTSLMFCIALMMNEKGRIIFVVKDETDKTLTMQYIARRGSTIDVTVILENHINICRLFKYDLIVNYKSLCKKEYLTELLQVNGRALIPVNKGTICEMEVIDKTYIDTFMIVKKIPMVMQHDKQVEYTQVADLEASESLKNQNSGPASSNSTNKSSSKEVPANFKVQAKLTDADVLHCPICSNLLEPPTGLCLQGHVFCSKCFKKYKQCTKCNSKFSSVENAVFDRALQNLNYKCKGARNGCGVQMNYKDLKQHGLDCDYCKEVECLQCNTKLFYKLCPDHVRQHDYKSVLQYPIKFHAEVQSWKKTTIVFYREVERNVMFEFYIKCTGKNLYIGARLLNELQKLEDYSFTVIIKNGVNELKNVTHPLPTSTLIPQLWEKSSLILESRTCLKLLKGTNIDAYCFMDKVH